MDGRPLLVATERASRSGSDGRAVDLEIERRRRTGPTDLSRAVTDLDPSMDRESLFWALVFSVPPGVGIVGFASFVIGRSYRDPLAIAAGLATTLVIFSVFALATGSGSADEDRENEIDL